MTQQFKFGDYVHHKIHGFGVIASHVKYDCAHVRFESMEEKHIDLKDLKLVPHPDTIRMSWLYQNGLSKVGKAAIFGANRKIQNIYDLREAIDDERYRSENPIPMNNTHE